MVSQEGEPAITLLAAEGRFRPHYPKRTPVVLSVRARQIVLGLKQGAEGLIARLLYGPAVWLFEVFSLRTEGTDFDRHVIVVRSGRCNTDRVGMLPRSLVPARQ